MQTEARVYGGKSGVERQQERRARLIEAGLDLLGRHGLSATTVRKVCQRAELPSRYFYESFADIDGLIAAVFDTVLDELMQRGFDAMSRVPHDLPSRVRAPLRCAIEMVANDPRKGRVALSLALASPILAERRSRAIELIATTIADLGTDYLVPGTDRLQLLTICRFFVGGFAELLTAWTDDPSMMTPKGLLDQCTELFLVTTSSVVLPIHRPTHT